jgi:hypothetical protein
MNQLKRLLRIGVITLSGTVCAYAAAQQAAPQPTQQAAPQPAQQAATKSAQQDEAAAKKKADAAAKAEKEKKELAASMEKVASRWRERAEANGWQTHSPTPVDPIPGFEASAKQSGPSGQPGGQLGKAAAAAEIRSEKIGTAPLSEDVKKPDNRHGDLLPPSIYPYENAERPPPAPAR